MKATVIITIIIIRLNYAECTPEGGQPVVNVPDLISIHNASHITCGNLLVAVLDGSLARMYCRSSNKKVRWVYAQSLKNLTFVPVLQKGRVVLQNESISIYRTAAEDAGVYRCQSDEPSGLVVLEVVDDDAYTVVQHGNTQAHNCQTIGQELTVFSVWSQWSECSACDEPGRRRRHGMCYVKLYNLTSSEEKRHNTSRRSFTTLRAFPEGIPCRSRHLPDDIRNLPAVRNKTNQIMITACKVACKQEIFKVSSPSGDVLETANNTAGEYSLAQSVPPQPPPPARHILFAGRGQRVLITCTGTTLRDIPVMWRVGDQLVEPELVRERSGGRVYVSARDHIVIQHVLYEDANLYSCWEGGNLAATVKLSVWAGAHAQWSHHSVLVALVLLGAVLLKVSMRIL